MFIEVGMRVVDVYVVLWNSKQKKVITVKPKVVESSKSLNLSYFVITIE